MTVLHFLRLTRNHLWLLLATVLLAVAIAAGVTALMPKRYTSACSAYVVVPGAAADASSGSSIAESKAGSYIPLVGSRAVAESVIEDAGLDGSPAEVAGDMTAALREDSSIIEFTATAETAQQAATMCSAVQKAMTAEAQRLENGGEEVEDEKKSPVKVVTFEEPTVPTGPSSPNWPVNLSIAALLGLLLGYAIVFGRRLLDTKVRTSAETEELVGAPVLGVIPETDDLAGHQRGGGDEGVAAEAFRQLRTNLRFVDVDHRPRSIVVTSANATEGKSTTTSQLGRVLAGAGQKVIVVDADLRRPMQATVWGLDSAVGLSQVVAGDLALADAVQPSGVDNLDILPAGRVPPNPSELLGSQRMHTVVTELADAGYLVLLDAPPLLPVTDAGLLGAQCDGVVLVLAVGGTYKEQASLAARNLQRVGAKLLGVVLNRAPEKGMGAVVYGNTYGYASYKQDEYSRKVYAVTSGGTETSERAGQADQSGKAGKAGKSVKRADKKAEKKAARGGGRRRA